MFVTFLREKTHLELVHTSDKFFNTLHDTQVAVHRSELICI